MDQTIQIGFSPCPNDTFIFDALINKKIDTGGLLFEAVMEDVETLNKWAIKKKLPVTKLSYGVLPLVLNNYNLLSSGGALGTGVGPLLISKGKNANRVEDCIIAIPGEHTTAHLLFSLAYPRAKNKIFMRYDSIESFVLDTSAERLGVIIHENRFTYQQKGLHKITDLGDYWERQTYGPIPLGGIVADRTMDMDTQKMINKLIRKIIEYAYTNYPSLNDFIRNNSQDMSEDVMRKHIDLYVNDYSLDLGEKGKLAVSTLINTYNKVNDIDDMSSLTIIE